MNPYRHLTILGVITVASLVFIGERVNSTSLAESHGAIPAIIVSAYQALAHGEISASVVRAFSRLVTNLFLHGDPEHLTYNMLFLWTFGYLTSQILGQLPALAIFLFCGICGNILQVCLNLESPIPIIGASGAICGLEGVYLGLALRWSLPWPDVWPLAYPIPPLQLAALAVLGFCVDMYFLTNHEMHIAFGAHVGGFLSGFAIAALITTVYPTVGAYNRGWRRG